MNGRLDGKVGIVTGGGKGIGRAESRLLAQLGAKVVVCDFARDRGVFLAENVIEEIRADGGDAVAVTDSVGTFAGARAAIDTAVEAFGRLDIVINNAGLRAAGSIEEITEKDYDELISSHITATFATTKYAIPVFVAQRAGVIVNTGSEAGLGHPYNSAYAAAKEAIAGFTRTIAREVGHLGVRCNQIRPRADTVRGQTFDEVLIRWKPEIDRLGHASLGRRGHIVIPSAPDDVAKFAVWLCTDAASGLNGRDFFVAGNEVGLWSEPEICRSVIRDAGWDLDSLDALAATTFASGLTNEFSK